MVDGVTVAPRGAYVHGRITQAGSARRLAGTAELGIEFTDIMIDEQLVTISTTGLQAQTGNEAARTVGRTARAAAIGGLIASTIFVLTSIPVLYYLFERPWRRPVVAAAPEPRPAAGD